MALSIISNQAASIATRQLGQSNDAATATAEKLSSGKRVNSAADDAAASAIAARLSAEVAGLQQASVNAGQASSLLQIADGAYQNVEDILTRAKSLSVQAGSDQISDQERAFLDQEFSALKTEIDRIAGDTEFNGSKLVDGEVRAQVPTASAAIGMVPTANGSVAIMTVDGGTGSVNNVNGSNFSMLDGITGIGFMGVQFGEGMTVDMTTMGNTVATLLRTGMIDFNVSVAANDGAAMLSVTFTAPVMTDGGGTAVRDFQFMTSLNGMTTGNMALTSTALNGAFVLSRAAMSASATANFNPTMDLTLNLGGTGDAAGSITVMITEMSFMAVSTSNMTTMPTATSASGTALLNGDDNMDFTFKVGTGTDATQDEIAVSIGGISTNALGIENSTIATKADADAASEAVSTAIDTLQEKRSEVGAAQNRLDFAGQNVELTRENQEAARSELEDLNVAKAITAFSQEQLLVQAGTSVLGQANQLPQNLLQLFR